MCMRRSIPDERPVLDTVWMQSEPQRTTAESGGNEERERERERYMQAFEILCPQQA